MPIKVQSELPAKRILENENIFIMDEHRALHQDIRPLRIAILNLMPLKEDTEVQLMRALSNSPLQIDITFLTTATYISTHTKANHLDQFYYTYNDIKYEKYDGLIITGAPVEQMEFEEVDYWEELVHIMDWAKNNVTSTLFICWSAQAALYHYYGIGKIPLGKKLFGVFPHYVHHRKVPLLRGFDDVFYAPHSRHTTVSQEEIEDNPAITILADSDEVGVFLAMAEEGKQIFMFGHPEYDRLTLDKEYKRDKSKNLPIEIPKNYYPDNDPTKKPLLSWRSHSNLIYSNWLNYYVYQVTPYDL